MMATGAGRGPVRVLDLRVRPDGDDGHELLVRGEVPEPGARPVYEVVVVGQVGRRRPAPEDAEKAGVLLGIERPPWWRRWLASEREKARHTRWHVKG